MTLPPPLPTATPRMKRTAMKRTAVTAIAFATLFGPLSAMPASAGIALSKVIVDLTPDTPPRDDIEVINSGTDRQYVVAEPSEILHPGTPEEKRVDSPDPTVTGLLVSPQKLVLEPGERKLVRVAMIAPRGDVERVYRLAIKPVAGSVQSDQTALKVFIGYDALVIARPAVATGRISATRQGGTITFHNGSNASVEMFEGRQCDSGGRNCRSLPSNRLYAGADWSVPIPFGTPVEYKIQQAKASTQQTF